ncbi:MAG: haloacid dehalogenase type II, partial [Sulfuricella sp.]
MGFSRAMPRSENLSAVRVRREERGIWQRRYWEHLIRDEADYRAHMDYPHINPGKKWSWATMTDIRRNARRLLPPTRALWPRTLEKMRNHMAIALAFDVYGTLIDTHGVIVALEKHVGNKVSEFSRTWREKQLEYSFRRGLMQNYENFAICTSNALDYTSSYFKVPLGKKDKDELMGAYAVLPAFDDVEEGLARAKKSGFRMFAFSNGSADAVETLLKNAGIRDYFIGVVSVDEMKSYKPNPGVYSHF